MPVMCPRCGEEFVPPRRGSRSVECPCCGTEFQPRRGRSGGSSDGSGLFVGVMLGLVGLMALAVGGAVFLFSSRAAPRPAPPEVVQVEPQQPQMRPVPQPMQVQQPPPRNPPVIPPGPFAGNPQPQPQPPPQAKTSYTQLVGTWQVINPVSGYPTRLVFHPDLTGDQTFDSGNGTARTNPFTTTVGAAGDTSLGVQLHVNMGMYGYSFEFLGPDRVRLGAGGQAPEYARVK